MVPDITSEEMEAKEVSTFLCIRQFLAYIGSIFLWEHLSAFSVVGKSNSVGKLISMK